MRWGKRRWRGDGIGGKKGERKGRRMGVRGSIVCFEDILFELLRIYPFA
jgi:hypothetical protein